MRDTTAAPAATHAIASCAAVQSLHELDPLALVLCATAGHAMWVASDNPMLDELTALLAARRPAGVPVLGCPPTTMAPQEVDASLVTTYACCRGVEPVGFGACSGSAPATMAQ